MKALFMKKYYRYRIRTLMKSSAYSPSIYNPLIWIITLNLRKKNWGGVNMLFMYK